MATCLNTLFVTLLLVLCKTEGSDIGTGIPKCSQYMDDCSTNPNQASITCVEETGGDGTCTSSDDANYAVDPLTFTSMDATACKDKCKAANAIDTPCFYYKFTYLGSKKYCYFMSEEQCKDWGDLGEDCKTSAHCESGPADETSCDPNNDGFDPPTFTCPKSSQPHAAGTYPDYKLHWQCRDGSGSVDIYTVDQVPGGTVCQAKPECDENDIEYTCLDADSDDVGAWVNTGTNTNNFINGDELTDPNCNAKDLEIFGYGEQVTAGMEIQCISGENEVISGQWEVSAQNSCLMLCDDIPVLHFYTSKNKWMYVNLIDNGSPEVLPDETAVETNMIYCWRL